MVKGLQPGFASGVVLALVDGVVRVALHLLGAALDYANDYAAALRVLPAERGIPVINAAYQVLRQVDGALNLKLLFRNEAAIESNRPEGGYA